RLTMELMRTWRENWKYPTFILCIYGFFSTVRPIEPFLFAYLTGPDKNLTAEELNNQIFPMSTYGNLAAQIPIFLLTDWLRYKPVVILECVALFTTTALNLWTASVPGQQASEFFFGVATASEVAYYSYIYSMVPVNKYRKATSYVRSVQLLGYTVGAVLAQLIFSFKLLSFNNIAILTLILLAIGLFTSFLLPVPQWSMFFHKKTKVTDLEFPGELNTKHVERTGEIKDKGEETANTTEDPQELAVEQTCGKVLLKMIRDSRDSFSSRKLLYWSLWWVMATCGFTQIVSFVQSLWEHVQPSQNASIYNGGVEAVSNLLSAATVYAIGYKEDRWERWEELALGAFSGLCSGALFVMTFSNNIWVCYVSFVIFKCLYMVLMTLAMFHIAIGLTMERYALVFGANNFSAVVLQTILTSIVVDKGGLGLSIIPQFIVYSSYFSVITAIFLLRGLYVTWSRKTKKQIPEPSVKNEAWVC
uniref:Solute carrier family 19 member 3a n=2 Tax=Tetraodon nigroviridis TaxID=99883 RepID=H3CDB6_TETNG